MCPRVFCDACDEPITEGKGAVLFNAHYEAHERTKMFFAHKGVCHDRMEVIVAGPGKHAGWTELRTFMSQLVSNVGIEPTALVPSEWDELA